MNTADLWNLHAQQLLGIPGWTWRKSEAVDPPGTFILTGAVYAETYKSGPRKGKIYSDKPTAGTARTVVMTRAAMAAFAAQWEQTSGVCSDCFGAKGREVWSTKANARQWQTCKRCGGSGGVEGVARPEAAAPVEEQLGMFGGKP